MRVGAGALGCGVRLAEESPERAGNWDRRAEKMALMRGEWREANCGHVWSDYLQGDGFGNVEVHGVALLRDVAEALIGHL